MTPAPVPDMPGTFRPPSSGKPPAARSKATAKRSGATGPAVPRRGGRTQQGARAPGRAGGRTQQGTQGDATVTPGAVPAAAPTATPAAAAGPKRSLIQNGAGGLLALFAYPLLLNTVKNGPAGATAWLKAKFFNETASAPSTTAGLSPAAAAAAKRAKPGQSRAAGPSHHIIPGV